MSDNRAKAIERVSNAWGRPLDSKAAGRMCSFLDIVAEWGERIHLVGRGNLEENIVMQALDSVLMLEALEREIGRSGGREREAVMPDRVRVADIGSGAGFPGMIWKILAPAIDIVLFERKRKAALFLERTARVLRMEGVKVFAGDADGYTGGAFDVVCSKASGNLETMIPLAERMLKAGGTYITIKGGGWRNEREGLEGPSRNRIYEIPLKMNRGAGVAFKKDS